MRIQKIKALLHNRLNLKDTGYTKILATAIITAILTSISQYYLQNTRLSGEQEYWEKRNNIEALDKLNSQKLQLIEDINKDLLQLEIKAKEIKIAAVASKYYTTLEGSRELVNLMVQYHKDLYYTAAKIQMVSIYFGDKVDSLIPILNESLRLNYQNNLISNSNGIKIPEFELNNMETIDTLIKTRLSFTKAMLEEINKSYTLESKQ